MARHTFKDEPAVAIRIVDPNTGEKRTQVFTQSMLDTAHPLAAGIVIDESYESVHATLPSHASSRRRIGRRLLGSVYVR